MKKIKAINNCLTILILLMLLSAQSVVAQNMAVIGDPGNSRGNLTSKLGNNNATEGKPGAVDYAFRMSAYEVTNSEYAEFLNAKAKIDLAYYQVDNAEHYDSGLYDDRMLDALPINLYAMEMGSSPHGGIVRSGSRGAFVYTVKPGFEEKPVNFVNKFDAQRYCNWLTNGKGDGDIETGIYINTGDRNDDSNGNAFYLNTLASDDEGRGHRNAEAWANGGYALPNADEWAKAAYYDPEKDSTGGYWIYPNRSDSPPSASQGNFDISEIDTVVDVGQYPSNGVYGVYDLAGNVDEWIEDNDPDIASDITMYWDDALKVVFFRGLPRNFVPGGSFNKPLYNTNYNYSLNTILLSEASDRGFRVVQGMKAVERWRHGHFNDDYETSAISGHEADPDKDGVINLLEYAQNLDPNDGADAHAGLGIEASGGVTALLYRKNSDAPDVDYRLEQTTDLSTTDWQPAELEAETLLNEEGNTLEFRATTSGSLADKRFYRIRVEAE
jgi:formylglycine-generating enzyme required for sulfatase activity